MKIYIKIVIALYSINRFLDNRKWTVDSLWRIRIVDMYGIIHCPEKILYKIFGINAEYLIDHA